MGLLVDRSVSWSDLSGTCCSSFVAFVSPFCVAGVTSGELAFLAFVHLFLCSWCVASGEPAFLAFCVAGGEPASGQLSSSFVPLQQVGQLF